MKTKKINILTEVEESIYDSVVVPHKKTKSFSRLVAMLLRGYMEDAYVKAYAEGTLDEVEAESVNALDDLITGMQGSLATMGVFTNELKNATQEGVEIFSNKTSAMQSSKSFRGNGFGGVNSVPVEPVAVVGEAPVSQPEGSTNEDLKATVEELKNQNREIMGLLQKLVSGEVQVSSKAVEVAPKTYETPVKSAPKPAVVSASDDIPKKPKTVETANEVDDLGEIPKLKVVAEEEESSKVDADDIMKSLLAGNMMSFKS